MSEFRARDQVFLRAVGLLLLATLALALFLVRSYQQSSGVLSSKFVLYAIADHVGGLDLDAPVALAGYKVGKVRAIELQPDKTLRLTFELENRARAFVRADSRAMLKKPLVGATSVDLTMGSTDQKVMRDGDTIALTVRPDFNDVVAMLPERLERVDRALSNLSEMSKTLNGAAQRLAGADGAINAALSEVRAAARGGRQAAQTLNETFTEMRATVKTAGPVLQQAQDALADIRIATAKASALGDSAARSMESLEVFTTALRQAAPLVNSTLVSGQSAADQADKTLRAARSSILFRKEAPEGAPAPLLITPRAP